MDTKPDEELHHVKPPFYQRKEFPPLAVFGGFLIILLLATAFSGRPPAIDRITQEDNLASEIVTIAGNNFGAPGTGGEVHIGDLALTQSNYLEWSEEEIVVSIPREVSSGIISVVTKNGRCRGDIYMNPDEIPRRTSFRGPLLGGLSAENLAPGRLLVIRGDRFGAERGNGKVSFSRIVPMDARRDDLAPADQLVSASDADLDYVLWTDTEIRVRVPDGAKTGLVMVATESGQSNYKYITVMPQPGKRILEKRARYRLRLGAYVSVTEAAAPNRLAVHVPAPLVSAEQRITPPVTMSAGVTAEADGGLVYARSDLAAGFFERFTVEFAVERYAVRTEIDPGLAHTPYDKTDPFYLTFLGDDRYVVTSHPAVAAFFRQLNLTETNPYLAARIVYHYVLDQLTPGDLAVEAGVDWQTLLSDKRGTAQAYAALYTALLRKAGIVARLVAGYYIDSRSAAHPHFWSEFFLPDFGWVPVDVWLGDNAAYGSSPAVPDARNQCFGNIDNRHLVFGKGFRERVPAGPGVRTSRGAGPVSLRSYDEAVTGGLGRYAVTWEGLTAVAAE